MDDGGYRLVGGSPEVRQLTWDWLAEKERQREEAQVPLGTSDSSHVTDPLILQPNVIGLSIDLKKLWWALKRWRRHT